MQCITVLHLYVFCNYFVIYFPLLTLLPMFRSWWVDVPARSFRPGFIWIHSVARSLLPRTWRCRASKGFHRTGQPADVENNRKQWSFKRVLESCFKTMIIYGLQFDLHFFLDVVSTSERKNICADNALPFREKICLHFKGLPRESTCCCIAGFSICVARCAGVLVPSCSIEIKT